MGSTRILVLSTLVALVSGAAVPALGVSATFTGTLTTFTGTGTGVSADTVPGSGTASYGIAAFTLPSGAFVTNHTSPIGWTSSAAQGTAYTIRQIVNQSSAAGNFASSGPSFGGVMSIGRSVTQQFGVVPFPVVFASIVLPVEAGAPGRRQPS